MLRAQVHRELLESRRDGGGGEDYSDYSDYDEEEESSSYYDDESSSNDSRDADEERGVSGSRVHDGGELDNDFSTAPDLEAPAPSVAIN